MSARGSFSIVRRLTALTVVVSVLALIVNGVLIWLAVRPLFEDLTDAVAGQVAAVRAALQESPPAARDAQALALSAMGLRVHRATAASPGEGSTNADDAGAASPDSFVVQLQRLLGPELELERARRGATGAHPQLTARFRVDGEP